MKKIFLIRHGESTDDAAGRVLSGVTDVSMTTRGYEQCRQLRRFFDHRPVGAVYASPLSRAQETARIIFPDQEPLPALELIELNFGVYEGIDLDVGKKTVADPILEAWERRPAEVIFPKGDSVAAHAQGALKGLKQIADSAVWRTAAIISHRIVIRLLVAQILGINLNFFRVLPCDSGSLTEITYDGEFILNSLNVSLWYTA